MVESFIILAARLPNTGMWEGRHSQISPFFTGINETWICLGTNTLSHRTPNRVQLQDTAEFENSNDESDFGYQNNSKIKKVSM
jgi:hypothetical protein